MIDYHWRQCHYLLLVSLLYTPFDCLRADGMRYILRQLVGYSSFVNSQDRIAEIRQVAAVLCLGCLHRC